MENTHEFKLVEGYFSPGEAEKLLMSLLEDKITFHNVESLSNRVRFGSDSVGSEQRVQELLRIKESLSAYLQMNRREGSRLEIHAVFELKVVDRESGG